MSYTRVSGIDMTMGYEGDFQRRQVTMTMLGKQWRYLFHVLIHCMSPRTTAFDQIGEVFSRALVCLATHRRFNFSRMIFEAIIRKFVGPRQNYKLLMYPRFVQMIINTLLPDLPNDGIELPLEQMQQVIFSSMNNVRKRSKFSGTVTPLFPNMIVEDPDPYFNIDDEVDDIMDSDVENVEGEDDGDDGDDGNNNSDNDAGNAEQANQNFKVNQQANLEEPENIEQPIDEVIETVNKPAEPQNIETEVQNEDHLIDETVQTPEVQATETPPIKKQKDVETEKTMPSTPPPSKGIVFKTPESKRLKTMARREVSGKGKGKEIPEKQKFKPTRDYNLVDEELLKFATKETSDTHLGLQTHYDNVTPPTNPVNQSNVNQEGPSTAQPHSVPSPVIETIFYGSQDMFDVDYLLNNQGEGMEITDDIEKDKDEDKEKEEEVEVVIIGERKDDDKPSDDDDDSSNDGTGNIGGGSNEQESSDEGDGSVIGKMGKIIEDRIPFEVPDEEEDQSTTTPKLNVIDKSLCSKFKTLPTWDIRELSHLDLINPSRNSNAANFETYLRNQCALDKFDSFQPQVPKCIKQKKKDKDGKRQFKCEYDSKTHEALITQQDLAKVRVFDPMDLFSFSDEDLKILYHNPIQCDMSSMNKTEAKLYMMVDTRCLSMRYEAKIIKKRLADLESKRVKVEAKPAADNN
ncbi:hypothetical protein L1987_06480 [Smallanthus sonchifolius]|uniref:Uncharacterized protein n=1 Tax=Smallanthus sonchifolius TaxID=185202 RepID=A0ACB9JYI0_9ASTR|nr:hypothetical protein L1987_06480 [Smallanthus sonchifolius]